MVSHSKCVKLSDSDTTHFISFSFRSCCSIRLDIHWIPMPIKYWHYFFCLFRFFVCWIYDSAQSFTSYATPFFRLHAFFCDLFFCVLPILFCFLFFFFCSNSPHGRTSVIAAHTIHSHKWRSPCRMALCWQSVLVLRLFSSHNPCNADQHYHREWYMALTTPTRQTGGKYDE